MDVVKQHYIVDLSSNNNFIQIPAMQGDGYGVRYAELELIQNGVPYVVNPSEVYVDIMGTKPDTKEIWNICDVTSEGYILAELTQQMLAVPGRGDYCINIISKENNRQLKSFPFIVITTKAPYDPKYIESSDEFQRLIAAIEEAGSSAEEAEEAARQAKVSETNAKASEVASKASEVAAKESEEHAEDWSDMSKSYAVGTDGSVRPGDATDNSKYYSEQSAQSALEAKDYKDSSEDFSERSKSYAVGTDGTYRAGDETDNSKYYSVQAHNSMASSQAILNDVIQEGQNAVEAIYNAKGITTPTWRINLETGHIEWEGGRFIWDVDETTGHILWEIVV